MNSVKREEEKRAVTQKQEAELSPTDVQVQGKGKEEGSPQAEKSGLYNDVAVEASHAELLGEPLEFTVKEYDEAPSDVNENVESNNKLTHLKAPSFVADRSTPELFDATLESSVSSEMNSENRSAYLGDGRLEPVISDQSDAKVESFSAIDSIVAENIEEIEERAAQIESDESINRDEDVNVNPPKKRRGSQLGMGWFQGFSLFIFGLLFVGLAAFAYFMFGEESLYSGKEVKYVAVPNEESGAMAALNPAIPEEERQRYIYVPKEPREVVEVAEVEVPALEGTEAQKFTQVEIVSHNDATGDDEISVETMVEESSALTLLSLDDSVGDLSQEDQSLIDSYLLQADIAYTQGNYVGVDQNDAYYYYQEILKLDPENSAAQQGLLNIADIYYRSAYDAYNYGQLDIAEQYVAIGLVVQPNHSALYQLKSIIDQKRAESQFDIPAFNQGVQGFQFE
ncbi:hypothetical protein B9T19_08870 [Ignatzschineria sp. F8392]|uniref:hypothetical protein n=1 Tax=Ignatzschineria sp. F8392 TaxID=1980117 RepID=UPI000B98AD20|nr:hypothetical protein [Ignatzschineria sp. F8392]OYQ78162.1 hypothetical protein B9T19_08870 [Ignatzschineria sp. F8392]